MFLILLLSLLPFSYAGEGGVNGGGTDHLPEDFNAAWFLDGIPARHVNVCIKHDTTEFPMDPAQVKATFLEAVKQWETYINRTGVNGDQVEDEDFDPAYLKVVTDFRFVKNCKMADLELYLGVVTKEIEEIKKNMFDPYAFVYRTSYDAKKGWGKGKLWLRGQKDGKFYWDKNKLLNLRGILLHELGHIFGTEHIGGTIMDASFAEHLVEYDLPEGEFTDKWFKYFMTNIDWQNELVQELTPDLKFPEGDLWMPGSKAESEAFKFLTQSLPIGEAKANLEIIRQGSDEQITMNYTVRDEQQTVTYPLVFSTATANFVSAERHIFRRFLRPEIPNSQLSSVSLTSDYRLVSIMGHMMKNKKAYPVILEGLIPYFEPMAYHAEDRREDALATRKHPYRLIGLDGVNRHILYGKYEWLELSSPAERKKLMKTR